ncbi:MAG: N-succinyldiaminopimelate aminotransferase [Actinomycetota bacterium]|nr:N-succinyldiaminopimelate aminotransferase [Actinomycetota bacterium]
MARWDGFGETIFAEMSALATATGSINLGQGFPDTDGPRGVAEAAIAAIRAGHNQYPPGPGIPELRRAVADHQRRFYGLDYDPDTEVLVTAGATEAIAATLLAVCEPGDEVVLFEPYYDQYSAAVAMAGATRRVVTLRPPDFRFDPDELAAAVGPRTRLVLLNSRTTPPARSSAATSSTPSPVSAWSTTCWRLPTRSTSTSSTRAPTCRWPPSPA